MLLSSTRHTNCVKNVNCHDIHPYKMNPYPTPLRRFLNFFSVCLCLQFGSLNNVLVLFDVVMGSEIAHKKWMMIWLEWCGNIIKENKINLKKIFDPKTRSFREKNDIKLINLCEKNVRETSFKKILSHSWAGFLGGYLMKKYWRLPI